MLQKIGILDFQSIKQLAVECGPITVFVGESDSGKSAVVRALYAAAFNSYPPDHVREGAVRSMVVVATEAGSVQVEKGKGVNSYALNLFHLEGQPASRKEWGRVGRDVPEEVAEHLGWRVVELDDGTKFAPSIQRQFDGPFLLADSPLKVAKVLGSLTNISTLFAAIREGTLEERRADRAREAALEEADRHRQAAEEAAEAHRIAQDRADRAGAALAVVVGLEDKHSTLLQLEVRVRNVTESVSRAVQDLNAARGREMSVPDLDQVADAIGGLRSLEEKLARMSAGVLNAELQLAARSEEDAVAQEALVAYVSGMEICPVCERPMHVEVHS